MDFYKITNNNEKHGEMKYQDGLNVDCLPFNPAGDCLIGGIYFSREDILAFLDYGPWLRKVTLPDGERVYENPGKPKKWKAHRVILGAREKIDANVVERLIKEGANVHAEDDFALRYAASNGHKEVVALLLESGANVHAEGDGALCRAAEEGHKEVVALLLERGANVHTIDEGALRYAASNGHKEVVALLLESGANVHRNNDYVMRLAERNGHKEIVELLEKAAEKGA